MADIRSLSAIPVAIPMDTATDKSTNGVINDNCMLASEESSMGSDTATPGDTMTTGEDTTGYPNKRPRRAAAAAAIQRVQEVLKWERCKESSSMFKSAADHINEEFDRVTRGERSYQKQPMVVEPLDAGGVVASLEGKVPDIPCDSDDEAAVKSDVEDLDEIDNDDEDNESLASFVVDDSYVSDASPIRVQTAQDSTGSWSEDDEDSGSDDDSEQNDSDFDNTVVYIDDSDTDYDDPEEDHDETGEGGGDTTQASGAGLCEDGEMPQVSGEVVSEGVRSVVGVAIVDTD
ncbi:hypothetical protein T484DRAFT_1756117 [Baffinella frigidus]|nr:hypothetical protein T484DRAFT_1756117 [Cryptophyta sp. CCMP2293]